MLTGVLVYFDLLNNYHRVLKLNGNLTHELLYSIGENRMKMRSVNKVIAIRLTDWHDGGLSFTICTDLTKN